jgi:hypothetical protein
MDLLRPSVAIILAKHLLLQLSVLLVIRTPILIACNTRHKYSVLVVYNSYKLH